MDKIPAVLSLANWAWGSNPSSEVSPKICLDAFPYLTMPCLTALFVKAVGIVIIIVACLNKAPVVINILKSKTVAGLSLSSHYSETVMYLNTVFYGFRRNLPFTAWGENLAMAAQSMWISVLMWNFSDPPVASNRRSLAVMALGVYCIIVFVFMEPEQMELLQWLNWPVLVYSRGAQILEVQKVRHTGTQSVITIGLMVVGAMVRILTTIGEVGWDMTLIAGFTLGGSLSLALVIQYFIFLPNTEKFLSEIEAKKKKKKAE